MSITYCIFNAIKVHYFVLVAVLICFSACTSKQQKEKRARSSYQLALCELSQGQQGSRSWRKALAHLDNALKNHESAPYYALKATMLFLLGKPEKSNLWFQKALKVCHKPRIKNEIMNNYACLLAEQGKKQEALAIWDSLVSNEHYLTPEVALVNRGKLHAKQGGMRQAYADFSRAVKISPGYIDAQFFLALAAENCQEIDLAKDTVRTVLYLDCNHKGAVALADRLFGEGVSPV